MKKFLATVILLLPVLLLSQELDKGITDEMNESLNANQRSTLRLLCKVAKLTVVEPSIKDNNPEPAATESGKRSGFMLFNRGYHQETLYNYKPSKAELDFKPLSCFASPGEYEPVAFGLYPLEEGKVSVTATPLKSASGIISDIEICVVKHQINNLIEGIAQVMPQTLRKENPFNIRPNVTKQVWLTARVPEDAKSGVYESEITVACAGKEPVKIKYSLEVLPVKLLEDTDMVFGWFWSPDDENGMKRYIEHGCNGLQPKMTPDMDYTGGSLKLNFDRADKIAASARKLGLDKFQHTVFTCDYANELMLKYGLKEFSPEFNKVYKEILAKMVEWAAKNKMKLCYWTIDEPREQTLNSWNRKLPETVAYGKLAKEVPGVKTWMDPMGDSNFGVDYLPLVDAYDVTAPHCIKDCEKLIARTKKLGKELWFYNSNENRVVFGVQPWKHGAKGRLEWVWTETYDNPPYLKWTREGIDDYKYIFTLETAIKAANASSGAEAKATAKKAADLLFDLKEKTPEYCEDYAAIESLNAKLDDYRRKIADFIITLKKQTK